MARIDWRHLTNYPAVRSALVVLGFILIGLTPVVGPIPGPGGVVVFAAGLSLVLKYSPGQGDCTCASSAAIRRKATGRIGG